MLPHSVYLDPSRGRGDIWPCPRAAEVGSIFARLFLIFFVTDWSR